MNVVRRDGEFSWVVNGRFKGGYITRHYGQPAAGVHALQLEMALRSYMPETEAPQFDDACAGSARSLLRALMQSVLQWPGPLPA